MTHLELFFAALYLSDGWYSWFAERKDMPQRNRIYGRARAVVLFDRVITGRIPHVEQQANNELRGQFRREPYNQGSWI